MLLTNPANPLKPPQHQQRHQHQQRPAAGPSTSSSATALVAAPAAAHAQGQQVGALQEPGPSRPFAVVLVPARPPLPALQAGAGDSTPGQSTVDRNTFSALVAKTVDRQQQFPLQLEERPFVGKRLCLSAPTGRERPPPPAALALQPLRPLAPPQPAPAQPAGGHAPRQQASAAAGLRAPALARRGLPAWFKGNGLVRKLSELLVLAVTAYVANKEVVSMYKAAYTTLLPHGFEPVGLRASAAACCALAPPRFAPRAPAQEVAALIALGPRALEQQLELMSDNAKARAALAAKQELLALGITKEQALANITAAGLGRSRAWLRRTCVDASAGLAQMRLSRLDRWLTPHTTPARELLVNIEQAALESKGWAEAAFESLQARAVAAAQAVSLPLPDAGAAADAAVAVKRRVLVGATELKARAAAMAAADGVGGRSYAWLRQRVGDAAAGIQQLRQHPGRRASASP